MTTQFTPGPWTTREVGIRFPKLAVEAGSKLVCELPVDSQNARLIASAPALYEALKSMLETFAGTTNSAFGVTEAEREARAALSQAEGK